MIVSVSVYEAACQSRFSSPEIIAILGDVVRRLRLLKGTRAAIGRRGFGADLQMLGEASVEDFMEALNIAKKSVALFPIDSCEGDDDDDGER